MPTHDQEPRFDRQPPRERVAAHLRAPWRKHFIKQGLVDPRNDEPSIAAMSKESGIHRSTLGRIISGHVRRPEITTIQSIADTLDVSFDEVAEWLREERGEDIRLEWRPPTESAMMTPPQRSAVEKIIMEFVYANRSEPLVRRED